MATKLKRLVGNAGAGIDESHGSDRLYAVLKELAETQNLMAASLNQLITDYDAETNAAHGATSAAPIPATSGVTVEP